MAKQNHNKKAGIKQVYIMSEFNPEDIIITGGPIKLGTTKEFNEKDFDENSHQIEFNILPPSKNPETQRFLKALSTSKAIYLCNTCNKEITDCACR